MQVTLFEVITVAAIIIGPILAILASRYLDSSHEARARRMDIFRTLMRTRRTPIVSDHVGALNLVEIEFSGKPNVINAWKKLMQHLGEGHSRKPDEEVSAAIDGEERQKRDEKYQKRLYDERQSLLAQLLHTIARDLGHRAEQLEIFEGGYTPQGWHDVELEQRIIRQYAVDLYRGHRVVPVAVVDFRSTDNTTNIASNDHESTSADIDRT